MMYVSGKCTQNIPLHKKEMHIRTLHYLTIPLLHICYGNGDFLILSVYTSNSCDFSTYLITTHEVYPARHKVF